MHKTLPNLFGLKNSNRDFSKIDSWGKNQFNSSFPASLCCYLASKKLDANYLIIRNKVLEHSFLSVKDLFQILPTSPSIFFAFEAVYMPFQKFVIGSLPRTDLVIQNIQTGKCLTGLEIKLTALPDNTTCNLDETRYGSELVVRPDTIVYLACSIATLFGSNLKHYIDNSIKIQDWSEPFLILNHIDRIILNLQKIVLAAEKTNTPFLLQPVWKTVGKSSKLSENCLDVFIWSDIAFTYFITNIASTSNTANKITRQTRTAIWLFKMLYDISKNGVFNPQDIIDRLSYNTKNDKSFASSGQVTNKFMASQNLTKPRISKYEIQNIILGNGQELLSPERRFDAILHNSPELFK